MGVSPHKKRKMGIRKKYGPYVRTAGKFVAGLAGRAALGYAGKVAKRKITEHFSRKKDTKKPKSGSLSTTKTKKALSVTAATSNETINVLRFRKRLRKPHKLSKKLGRWSYENQVTASINNLFGQQGVTDLFFWNGFQQYYVDNTGAAAASYQSDISFFEMNPWRLTTGDVSGALAEGIKPSNDRVYLKRVSGEVSFVNSGSLPCELQLFWVEAKKPANQGPTTHWTDALTQQGFGQATAVQASDAGGSVTAGVPGQAKIVHYGQSPLNNKDFRSFYKVLKIQNLAMASQAIFKIKFDFETNQLVDSQRLAAINEDLGSVALMPGTIVLMAVVKGVPCKTTTHEIVTVSESEVCATMYSKYSLISVGQTAADVKRTNPQFAGITGGFGTPSDPISFINELGAIATAVVQA
nr:MAG: capsid protein [Cressdnaviricota sp.]